MKTLFYLLLMTFFFTSCEIDTGFEPIEPLEDRTVVFSYDFMADQNHPNFVSIHLDSFRDYGELIREMQRLSCANKRVGIQFSDGDTLYGISGFTECPDDGIIACYFNRNLIFIENDSLKDLGRLHQKSSKHIHELHTVLERMRMDEFRYAYGNKVLSPALLHLYVDPKHHISKTREVLKEIVISFKEVNTEMGPHFLKYNILFEDLALADILTPPPPPPPQADWE